MRKPLAILGLIVVVLAIWYFVFKPYDFRVRFQSSNPKSLIFKVLEKNNKDHNFKTVTNNEESDLEQIVEFKDSLYHLNWKISPINDTLNEVILYARDDKNSFYQKLNTLFRKTDFTRKMVNIAKNQQENLDIFKENYRLSTVDTAIVSVQNAIYTEAKSTLADKAKVMLHSIMYPMGYIKDHQIQIQGDPFLRVEQWNPESDSIDFQFGFPIPENHKINETVKVKISSAFTRKALHCVFNGDYRYSDIAWFYLLEYAQKNSVSIENEVIEVFRNDPHAGGNPLDWKADIYIPLK